MPVTCGNCCFSAEGDEHYFAGDNCPQCDDGKLRGHGGSS